jgi:hypothetical protein
MCMHPWFFSIGRLHFGQGLELASILSVIKYKISIKQHQLLIVSTIYNYLLTALHVCVCVCVMTYIPVINKRE